jgi:hypothetical protein
MPFENKPSAETAMFRLTSCMNLQERQPVRIVWNPSANGNDGGYGGFHKSTKDWLLLLQPGRQRMSLGT